MEFVIRQAVEEEIQIVLKRYLEKIVLHFYKKENEKRMSCK